MPRKNSGSNNIAGRDQILSAGDRSVVFSGDARNNSITAGDHNRVENSPKFISVYQQIEVRIDLTTSGKADLKSELQSFESEDKKGPEANEGFLAQRLRNIKRIAPDILDAAIATITGPAAGFSMIAKRVAEKMKIETK